ncbi:hypothetical protein [Gottfriedia solisilvae]
MEIILWRVYFGFPLQLTHALVVQQIEDDHYSIILYFAKWQFS